MGLTKELPGLLRRAQKRHQVPGASLAIMRNGRITAKAVAGVTNLGTRVPVTRVTVFQVGSISKPHTASLIMQRVDEGSLFPIGAKWSYCNLGFAVLGRVIEVITGQAWEMALKTRLFDRLGMDHAFSQSERATRFNCAMGHLPGQQKKRPWVTSSIPYLSLGQKAAGSTPSMTATELLRFAALHMSAGKAADGQRLLIGHRT